MTGGKRFVNANGWSNIIKVNIFSDYGKINLSIKLYSLSQSAMSIRWYKTFIAVARYGSCLKPFEDGQGVKQYFFRA